MDLLTLSELQKSFCRFGFDASPFAHHHRYFLAKPFTEL
jgi:hypothetical protein